MNRYWNWAATLRVGAAAVGGGLFYACWLAIFLMTRSWESAALEILLTILAPPVTATGFAMGVRAFGRLTGSEIPSFQKIVVWPLTGCILGALIVYWFGPMLIVFSMLLLGTAAIALREISLAHQRRAGERP